MDEGYHLLDVANDAVHCFFHLRRNLLKQDDIY